MTNHNGKQNPLYYHKRCQENCYHSPQGAGTARHGSSGWVGRCLGYISALPCASGAPWKIGILYYRYSNKWRQSSVIIRMYLVSYIFASRTVSIHASIGRLVMARQPIQRSAVSCEQKRDLPVLPRDDDARKGPIDVIMLSLQRSMEAVTKGRR